MSVWRPVTPAHWRHISIIPESSGYSLRFFGSLSRITPAHLKILKVEGVTDGITLDLAVKLGEPLEAALRAGLPKGRKR